jgi:hypothetical protein
MADCFRMGLKFERPAKYPRHGCGLQPAPGSCVGHTSPWDLSTVSCVSRSWPRLRSAKTMSTQIPTSRSFQPWNPRPVVSRSVRYTRRARLDPRDEVTMFCTLTPMTLTAFTDGSSVLGHPAAGATPPSYSTPLATGLRSAATRR